MFAVNRTYVLVFIYVYNLNFIVVALAESAFSANIQPMNTNEINPLDYAKFVNYNAAYAHATTFRLNIVFVNNRYWTVDAATTDKLEALGYRVVTRNY